MMKFVKKITSIVTSAMLCLTMAVNVSASENYKTWTQSDSRWANKTLGSCSDTMSEIGCAVTSIAILAVHSQSASTDSFNPGILCDYLSNNNGFDSFGNLYWGAVSGLVPDFTFQKKAYLSSNTESGITSELAGYINQGYYIVLSVQYDGHWVAVDTVKNGEVYMIDPAQNSNNNLFDCYDSDGVLQVRLYKGKNDPSQASSSSSSASATNYLTGHYKTTSALNHRMLYNTTSTIYSTIPSGTTVVVTRVYNNQWGQVEYNGKTGWIYLEYTEYTEPSYTYKTGNYKVNTTGGVNLRRSIGTQGTVEWLVPYNATVTIDMVMANWGRASYNGHTGWLCMEYVTYTGSASATPAVTTAVTTTKTVTTTAMVTTTTVASSLAPLMKGDISRDGKFTKNDLILLNNYIAKPETIDSEKRYIMDVNSDKEINEKDSVYLLKIINKGN